MTGDRNGREGPTVQTRSIAGGGSWQLWIGDTYTGACILGCYRSMTGLLLDFGSAQREDLQLWIGEEDGWEVGTARLKQAVHKR